MTPIFIVVFIVFVGADVLDLDLDRRCWFVFLSLGYVGGDLFISGEKWALLFGEFLEFVCGAGY